MSVVRVAPFPFDLCRLTQFENNSQSKIETPKGLLGWKLPFGNQRSGSFRDWCSIYGKGVSFLVYFYFLPLGDGAMLSEQCPFLVSICDFNRFPTVLCAFYLVWRSGKEKKYPSWERIFNLML